MGAEDVSATAIAFELGVLPQKLNLGGAYRLGNTEASTKRSDNALLLGAKYFIAQNIQVQANYESYSNSR